MEAAPKPAHEPPAQAPQSASPEPQVPEPPATQPPVTQPPVTQPPVTEPPVAEPPPSGPPAATPPAEPATAPPASMQPPAAVPPPQPARPAPAAAAPVEAAPAAPPRFVSRSGAAGDCPDCKSEETAVTVERPVAPGAPADGGDCGAGMGSAARQAAARLADRAAGLGPGMPLDGGELAPFTTTEASCQVVGVVLPPGVRYRGYTYEVEAGGGAGGPATTRTTARSPAPCGPGGR